MIYTKTYRGECKSCGKEYVATNKHRVVCLACSPKMNCLVCGKEYKRTRGAQKYCSRKCMTLHDKTKRLKGAFVIENDTYYHLKKCGKCGTQIKTRFGNSKWCDKCKRDYKDQSKELKEPRKELYIKQLGYSVTPCAMSYIMAGMRYD